MDLNIVRIVHTINDHRMSGTAGNLDDCDILTLFVLLSVIDIFVIVGREFD